MHPDERRSRVVGNILIKVFSGKCCDLWINGHGVDESFERVDQVSMKTHESPEIASQDRR